MQALPGIEVIIGDFRKPPSCPHGPTLLFRRVVDGKERLFYACSACRDRKDCRFFQWADEEITDSKKKVWDLEKQKIVQKIQHSKLYIKFMKLLQSPTNRAYCHSCNELVSTYETAHHANHEIVTSLTDHQLTHPSELLKPLGNPKKEAQYLFAKQTTKTIVSALEHLGCKHILCIGAPRIHEYILEECSLKMDSLLLDIDHRYRQFHGPLQFCWFNAFNNHFFDGETSSEVVQDFLSQDSGNGVAVIIDPPFGGRVEPLANTIQLMTKLHQSLCPKADSSLKVMWVFPYFMETHILSSLPDYQMLDYKVDYENHPLFTQGPQGRKFGSPVRIFTNVSPSEIPLPLEEGYKYCKKCKKWVSKENKHCKKCSSCTSKDGRTYVHCSTCNRCVKPSWSHCQECQRCCQQSHKCGEFKPNASCFNCGESGHKKADCHVASKKRKAIQQEVTPIESKRVKKFKKSEKIPKKRKVTDIEAKGLKKLKKSEIIPKQQEVTEMEKKGVKKLMKSKKVLKQKQKNSKKAKKMQK